MILVYFTVGSTSSGSAFVIAPNLGAKILSEYFTGSAPPILCYWSYSQIGCSTPLYSQSVSLIGSAYLFLYISFCFWFNKLLTNLTLLRQHLQYNFDPGKLVLYSECSAYITKQVALNKSSLLLRIIFQNTQTLQLFTKIIKLESIYKHN